MQVSVTGYSIVSPYGIGAEKTFQKVLEGKSMVRYNTDLELSPLPSYVSNIGEDLFESIQVPDYTRLESMMIKSIEEACSDAKISLKSKNTLLILSTTKGNIDLLEGDNYKGFNKKRTYLSELGNLLQDYFKANNNPLIVSNACISGGCSIELGNDLLLSKKYQNIVVCGGDILSEFVLSGFRSFHALSDTPSKPYDKKRDGINLGETSATIVLSTENKNEIKLLGTATSNDANHISGPSRNGEGLFLAVQGAMKMAGVAPEDLDYISAHGTATNYNDEMESIAFGRCSLSNVPLNSYKGYFGHTLGAAGIIESVLAIKCLEKNWLIKSIGYEKHGVTEPLNVIKTTEPKELRCVLKTGSGFGGGNNALIFGKSNG
jgi:3-oxoacyl-[acyl-carrier-protein] synthase-1